jgi:hypothetical protein
MGSGTAKVKILEDECWVESVIVGLGSTDSDGETYPHNSAHLTVDHEFATHIAQWLALGERGEAGPEWHDWDVVHFHQVRHVGVGNVVETRRLSAQGSLPGALYSSGQLKKSLSTIMAPRKPLMQRLGMERTAIENSVDDDYYSFRRLSLRYMTFWFVG